MHNINYFNSTIYQVINNIQYNIILFNNFTSKFNHEPPSAQSIITSAISCTQILFFPKMLFHFSYNSIVLVHFINIILQLTFGKPYTHRVSSSITTSVLPFLSCNSRLLGSNLLTIRYPYRIPRLHYIMY